MESGRGYAVYRDNPTDRSDCPNNQRIRIAAFVANVLDQTLITSPY